MIDMMDENLGRRSTGLTRAKHLERLTLWLGLPLLLALLCLAAGVVNYTPVRRYEAVNRPQPVQPTQPAPVEEAPRANPMPMRGESLRPGSPPEGVGQAIHALEIPTLS